MFTWTEEQLTAFAAGVDAAYGRIGDVGVRARAGTAKTTTLGETSRRIIAAKPDTKIMACAYNIRTGKELVKQLDGIPGVWVARYTQIGFAFLRHVFRGITVDRFKGRDCAVAACIDAKKTWKNRSGVMVPDRGWVGRVGRLASLAKHTMPETLDDLSLLASRRGMSDAKYPALELAAIAARALDIAVADNSRVDMDDMVWMPCKYDLSPPWVFDIVVSDESQDCDPAQLWLLRRIIKPNTGRLMFFGDDRQALYSWKGASTDTFNRMITEYDMEIVPLTRSFRCSHAVVGDAQRFVPDYVADPKADAGAVERVRKWSAVRGACAPGDFILSRTRAMLAEVGFDVARSGTPVRIVGYDSAVLLAMIEESRAQTVRDFLIWLKRQEEAINTKENEESESIDVIRTLIAIAKHCDTIADIETKIRQLIIKEDSEDDPTKYVTCSTVHAAKGLEVKDRNSSVYLVGESFKSNFDIEEDNIQYVAITRAKNRLVWVGEPRMYEDRVPPTPAPSITPAVLAKSTKPIPIIEELFGREESSPVSTPAPTAKGPSVRPNFGRQLDLDLGEES